MRCATGAGLQLESWLHCLWPSVRWPPTAEHAALPLKHLQIWLAESACGCVRLRMLCLSQVEVPVAKGMTSSLLFLRCCCLCCPAPP